MLGALAHTRQIHHEAGIGLQVFEGVRKRQGPNLPDRDSGLDPTVTRDRGSQPLLGSGRDEPSGCFLRSRMMASDRPCAVEGLEVTEVADGLVVYDPERERVHYLNASAAVIFAFCDGAHDRRGIVDATTSMFGPDAMSSRDVEACIAELEDKRILNLGK